MAARSEVRLPVLTGRAWAFADDLAAADILPARFALLPAPEGARRLFADLDAALAAQLRAGDVLVAGQQLGAGPGGGEARSEEHTSELQSRTLISYAVFCLKKKK